MNSWLRRRPAFFYCFSNINDAIEIKRLCFFPFRAHWEATILKVELNEFFVPMWLVIKLDILNALHHLPTTLRVWKLHSFGTILVQPLNYARRGFLSLTVILHFFSALLLFPHMFEVAWSDTTHLGTDTMTHVDDTTQRLHPDSGLDFGPSVAFEDATVDNEREFTLKSYVGFVIKLGGVLQSSVSQLAKGILLGSINKVFRQDYQIFWRLTDRYNLVHKVDFQQTVVKSLVFASFRDYPLRLQLLAQKHFRQVYSKVIVQIYKVVLVAHDQLFVLVRHKFR